MTGKYQRTRSIDLSVDANAYCIAVKQVYWSVFRRLVDRGMKFVFFRDL